jgi:hypothetical protein
MAAYFPKVGGVTGEAKDQGHKGRPSGSDRYKGSCR